MAVVARADCAEDAYVCKSFAITTSLQFYRVGKVNTKDGKVKCLIKDRLQISNIANLRE